MERLIRFADHKKYRQIQNEECMEQDPVRFAGLEPVEAIVRVRMNDAKPISEHLIGIFFEDINYSADGGLYAELIQNRDFEYTPTDRGNDRNWNSIHSWSVQGNGATLSIRTDAPIHPNNPHYAVLDVRQPGAALQNAGFDGIVVKKGEKYDFSLFSKAMKGKGGKVKVGLVDGAGRKLAQTVVSVSSKEWKQQRAVLTVTADAVDAVLSICPQVAGEYALDMISLFPQKTFKGRKNGLPCRSGTDIGRSASPFHAFSRRMRGSWRWGR